MKKKELPIGLTDKMLLKDINPFKFIGKVRDWRTYKSGKKVWIAPYRKGKERNNPKVYVPKEYVKEEE